MRDLVWASAATAGGLAAAVDGARIVGDPSIPVLGLGYDSRLVESGWCFAALPGADHDGVLLCLRDDEGWTRLQPLTELPNYFSVVTGGTLGRAAVQDRLRPATAQRTPSELIDELFRTG